MFWLDLCAVPLLNGPMRFFLPLALLLLLDAPARGQKTDPELTHARALFKQAEVHFSLGEFAQALKHYKEAYRIRQLPEFLFNIGQCQRHLGNCKDAVFHFRQFLLHQPSAPERKQVNELILECEAKMAAEEVTSRPTSQPTPPDGPHPAAPRISRTWFWVGVGVSGGLLATSLVTGLLAVDRNNTYNDPGTPVDRRRELKDQGEALELTAWTTLGIGVAAAGATAALFWLSRPAPHEARTVSFAPLRGGGVFSLQGSF